MKIDWCKITEATHGKMSRGNYQAQWSCNDMHAMFRAYHEQLEVAMKIEANTKGRRCVSCIHDPTPFPKEYFGDLENNYTPTSELKAYIKRLEEYIHENMCIVLPQYDNCVCVDCRDAKKVLATRPEGLESGG